MVDMDTVRVLLQVKVNLQQQINVVDQCIDIVQKYVEDKVNGIDTKNSVIEKIITTTTPV